MASLHIRNFTLMVLIVCCFLQVGAQLFAISVVARTLVEAPPSSFAILEGKYRDDSSAFWDTLPPITGLMFIIALIFNWRTRRRAFVLAGFGLFVSAGLIAELLLEPEFANMTAIGFRDVSDPALQSRAKTWYYFDWAVWCLSLTAGIALLLALNRSAAISDGTKAA